MTIAPHLHTHRLIIKTLELDDARALFRYRSDERVYKYQLWRPNDEAEAVEFIRKHTNPDFGTPHTWHQMGLYLAQTSTLIGDLGLHFLTEQSRGVEIGFTVAPEFQRQGYALEAVQRILTYLFETMGKHRVTASIDPRNKASAALLKKLGMREEAHFRESLWCHGEWVDDVVYTVLRSEWN